jgi:prevent-host-death family protein
MVPVKTVNLQEARNDLPRLVEDAANGEPFVIAEGGKPLVKVVAVEKAAEDEPPKLRKIGALDGQFFIPEDLDKELDKEIEDLFYAADS